jgi:hypothetical protein
MRTPDNYTRDECAPRSAGDNSPHFAYTISYTAVAGGPIRTAMERGASS